MCRYWLATASNRPPPVSLQRAQAGPVPLSRLRLPRRGLSRYSALCGPVLPSSGLFPAKGALRVTRRLITPQRETGGLQPRRAFPDDSLSMALGTTTGRMGSANSDQGGWRMDDSGTSPQGVDEVVATLKQNLIVESPPVDQDVAALSFRQLLLRVGARQRECVPAIALAQALAGDRSSFFTDTGRETAARSPPERGRPVSRPCCHLWRSGKKSSGSPQAIEHRPTNGGRLEHWVRGSDPNPLAPHLFFAPSR